MEIVVTKNGKRSPEAEAKLRALAEKHGEEAVMLGLAYLTGADWKTVDQCLAEDRMHLKFEPIEPEGLTYDI